MSKPKTHRQKMAEQLRAELESRAAEIWRYVRLDAMKFHPLNAGRVQSRIMELLELSIEVVVKQRDEALDEVARLRGQVKDLKKKAKADKAEAVLTPQAE